jgi:hypothetical protein
MEFLKVLPPVKTIIKRLLSGSVTPAQNLFLAAIALLAFLVLFQNYGVTIIPPKRFEINAKDIYPLANEKSFAYVYKFNHSEPDILWKPRSQIQLLENNNAYVMRNHLFRVEEVKIVGGGRWNHEPGRIIFSSSDNTDPRTNGRVYTVLSPRYYTRNIGYCAALVFSVSVLSLVFLNWKKPRPSSTTSRQKRIESTSTNWRWHLAGASCLLMAGLYCNTGTLAPYGNTHFGHVAKETGYLYNIDHEYFRVLFDFVDGAPRSVWDNTILMRRILYNVLAWPFMKIGGFEIGGTIASIVFNVAAFGFSIRLLRTRIGEKGAVFACWLLALYPGSMYWGGLPYPYASIFPLSLLLMIALVHLPNLKIWPLCFVSLAMGIAYLSYDLVVYFLPASLLLLIWKRRPKATIVSTALQIIPSLSWLLYLKLALGQDLENSNTASYRAVINSYLNVQDMASWFKYASDFPNVGLDVWFGSNFIFIPALFLVLLAINPLTSRIRFAPSEIALLAVTTSLFLFNNLAPDYYGASTWVMRGTWISRIYQPVFPALIFFCARWWQALPPQNWPRQTIILLAVGVTCIGNALITFGPILNNPLKVSEHAFYRFYNHTDLHWVYEYHLKDSGRRPIGFPKKQP